MGIMHIISFRRLLAAAPIAALVGSTVGSALFFWDEFLGHPLRHLMGETGRYSIPPLSDLWLGYPVVWMISLFGTIPGSILIGVPTIFPFRNIIARHPLGTSIPVSALALILATLLFGWSITPTAFGTKEYEVLWFYSASSAIGFVAILGWWGRPHRHPA